MFPILSKSMWTATVWLPTFFKISSYWCECMWCCTVYWYGSARTTADRMCAVAQYNDVSSKADRGDVFIRAAGQMGALSRRKSEFDVTYGQVWWPILEIRALHLTHPKCTHTAVNTHPEQWAVLLVIMGLVFTGNCNGPCWSLLVIGHLLLVAC